MYISAKSDYAVRALLELAAHPTAGPITGERLAASQGLPTKFLENTLVDLRRAGIVVSQRGSEGGYRLAREPAKVTIAEVMRALDGPLAEVRGLRPEAAEYDGAAANLQAVWIAVRAALRSVLDQVTLADVVDGRLPRAVQRLVDDPSAWVAR